MHSDALIADISEYSGVPEEISGEDVYDWSLLFRNEEVAINYICEHYDVQREEILQELHEEDYCREIYGKENYLRSAQIQLTTYISELNDGTYILWKSF